MFLNNCWYVAAWDHELIDGGLLARTVPGIFFMETLFAPAGSGAQGRDDPGNTPGAKQYRNCQFFTPETGRSTHFSGITCTTTTSTTRPSRSRSTRAWWKAGRSARE